jgi:hypothetical protein
MKTTSLRIISALLVLSVLWVNVPGVRADDGTDYVTEINQYVDQIYQDQKQTDDYLQSIQDGIDQARNQSDDTLNVQPAAPVAPAVAAPRVNFQPVPHDPVAFAQMVRQNQERAQQQILRGQQQLLQRQQQILQQAGRVVAPQQFAVPQNPVAFQQMVLQNQERFRSRFRQANSRSCK